MATLQLRRVGRSMNPTFGEAQDITVRPYGKRAPRVGDVVAFRPPGREGYVVHRIVGMDARGIRTRGDNNAAEDSWLLSPEQIAGYVASVRSGNRTTRIRGGVGGRVHAGILRGRRRVDRALVKTLHPVYRMLSVRSPLKGMGSRLIRMRVVHFKRGNGSEMHLYWGRRLIGRRPAGSHGGWSIFPPYRLVVDEDTLP